MKTSIPLLKKILMIWGGIALLGILIIGGLILYEISFGNKAAIDKATAQDVRFVLNWCGLGDERIKDIKNSYVSARSFTGDHLDAYAIEIKKVDVDKLTKENTMPYHEWFRGDQLPNILDDAVNQISAYSGGNEIPWFPKVARLRSNNFHIYPVSIYYAGTYPTAFQIIFIEPSKNMVYYISAKQ